MGYTFLLSCLRKRNVGVCLPYLTMPDLTMQGQPHPLSACHRPDAQPCRI